MSQERSMRLCRRRNIRMLTAKRERFCPEMIKPKATQIKAYKAAFNVKENESSRYGCRIFEIDEEP